MVLGGGAFFGTVYCRIAGASPPGPPPGLCPGPTGGLITPPPQDNQLLQAMKYGHCISCFRQDTTFIHAFTTNLAHHSKFLLKRPAIPSFSFVFNYQVSYYKIIHYQNSCKILTKYPSDPLYPHTRVPVYPRFILTVNQKSSVMKTPANQFCFNCTVRLVFEHDLLF